MSDRKRREYVNFEYAGTNYYVISTVGRIAPEAEKSRITAYRSKAENKSRAMQVEKNPHSRVAPLALWRQSSPLFSLECLSILGKGVNSRGEAMESN